MHPLGVSKKRNILDDVSKMQASAAVLDDVTEVEINVVMFNTSYDGEKQLETLLPKKKVLNGFNHNND